MAFSMMCKSTRILRTLLRPMAKWGFLTIGLSRPRKGIMYSLILSWMLPCIYKSLQTTPVWQVPSVALWACK